MSAMVETTAVVQNNAVAATIVPSDDELVARVRAGE